MQKLLQATITVHGNQ